MTEHADERGPAGATDDLDPAVVEHVEAIRDRFGLRGLRGAQALIADEIATAERALADLPTD